MIYKFPIFITLSCLALLVLPITAVPGTTHETTNIGPTPLGGSNGRDAGVISALSNTANDALNFVPGEVSNEKPYIKSRTSQATFIGCTIGGQRNITTVIATVKKTIISAYQFTAAPGNFFSKRFVTWFGPYQESRAQTVLQNWERAVAANLDTWVYDCSSCTLNVGATSNSSRYGEISICSAFYTGNASFQSDAIITQLFGFDIIAGAKLYSAYDQQATKNLAINSSDKAIDNVYSYVFYANNSLPL